jgi:NAD(P)H dehydrogenase (quinone)
LFYFGPIPGFSFVKKINKTMIAITGASGNLGTATTSFLLEKTDPQNIVAVIRDPAKAQIFGNSGIEVRIADYNDPVSLRAAFRNVEKVLQVSSAAYGEDALKEERNVVEAAVASGVKHILYTSTLHPHAEALFFAGRTCLATENLIHKSGIGYTFFRSSMYMETIPQFIGSAVHDGQISYPGGSGKISFVSRREIAEAAAFVLLTTSAVSEVYAITGSEAFSFQHIADMLQSQKGLAATYSDISNEVYKEELQKYQIPEADSEFYVSMADAIKAGEFSGVDNGLEKLLSHKRLSLEEYMGTL